MGATTFETYGMGRDVDSAFRAARDHAFYMHGHGGYTGTLAEKGSYQVVRIPAGVRCSPKKFLDLLYEMEDFVSVGYLRGDLKWCKTAAEKRALESQIKKEERKQASFWRKNIALKATLEHAAITYQDKWGACLAIQVGGAQAVGIKREAGRAGTRDQVWLFCGWASC